MLKITQVKSAIRRKQDHKDTLRALGLRRLHQSVYHEDTDVVRGMVRKVSYMLEVSEVEAAETAAEPAVPAEAAGEAPAEGDAETSEDAEDEE